MKTLIIAGSIVAGILGMTMAEASEDNGQIICSKNVRGIHYIARFKMTDTTMKVFVTGSNNNATRRGEQSEGPVAEAEFNINVPAEGQDSEVLVLDQLVSEPQFNKLSRVEMAPGTVEEVMMTIYGEKLPHGKIKFTNCLTAD